MILLRIRVAFTAAVLALAAARAEGACHGYSTPTFVDIGLGPYSITAGDFDRNGKPDVVFANSTGNTVTLRRGDGNGGFTAGPGTGVGTFPVYVLNGDFNADGKLDVAVANRDSANVSILIGDGSGSFAAAVNYTVGTQPHGIAAADFNRDGRLDLATANFAGNTISLLLGVGDGTFTVSPTTLAATGAVAVAAGDFNRDGKADLAAAKFTSSAVAIFLGAGDGTFSSGNDLTTQVNPRAIGVGDFDGNGTGDLAIVNENSDSVSVYLSPGNGTFGNPTHYGVGYTPRSIVVADLTGDGKPDLAVANFNNDNVSVLAGNGNGTFQGKTDFTVSDGFFGDGPRGIAAAHLNADDRLDLVTANGTSQDLSVLLNQSVCNTNCGEFLPAVNYDTGSSPSRASKGDFNRDGKLDLAVPNSSSNSVSILLGAGDGTFTAGTPLSAATTPSSTAVADFNRDGKLDLAVGHSVTTTLSIFIGNGDGTFSAAGSPPNITAGTSDIVTADFNLDGKPDLAAVRLGMLSLAVLLGNGDGTFGAMSTVTVGGQSPQAVETADFNRDGKPDLACTNGNTNNISVLLGNGTGGFAAASNIALGSETRDLIAGDFNHDGASDLAVSRSTNILSILNGTGLGGFVAAQNGTLNAAPFRLAAIDTGGGATAIVATLSTNSVAWVYLNPSTGAPSTTQYFDVGSSPTAVTGGDFNRDGRDDLAVSNLNSHDVSILLNSCESFVDLSASANPSYFGYNVTFTAGVGGSSALIGPSGSVTFRDGDTVLGTVTLDNSYLAELTTSSLAIGNHSITATYNGDTIFRPSTTFELTHSILLAPPTTVYATPNAAATQVSVNWNAAPGATSYEVFRSFNNSGFTSLGTTTSLTHVDSNVSPNIAYVYKLRSLQGANISPFSFLTAATTIVFTDGPFLVAGNIIKRVHMTELRTGVNLVRASAGLQAYSFTDTTPVIVKAVHVQELTTALSQAYIALGMGPYIGPLPSTGSIIRAVTLNEVRSYIRSAPFGPGPN